MSDACDKKIEDEIRKYREALLECDKASVQEYDKAVMTLSGGAIGLSFTFLENLLKVGSAKHICILLCAWTVWGLSITVVLASHYFSHRAMRRALSDLNNEKLNYDNPGGGWDTAINILNPIGGLLFLAGLLLLLSFLTTNNFESKPQSEQMVQKTAVVRTVSIVTTTEDVINQTTQAIPAEVSGSLSKQLPGTRKE